MRRKSICILLSLTLIFAFSFVGCTSGEEGVDGEAVVIKGNLGMMFADVSSQYGSAEIFADRVQELTDGTIQISIFPSGQIGGDESMAEDMARGNLEFAYLNCGSCAGFDQMLDFHYLPFTATNYEEADQLYYGDGIIPTLLTETLESHDIKVLGWFENEFRGVSNSKRPVKTASDLNGMKIRVPGSAAIDDFFLEAGAQCVTIPGPEIYTALQQKTVDGQDNGILASMNNKLIEPQDYYTNTNHVYATGVIAVSNATWEKLSSKQQEALLTAAAEAQEWQIQKNRAQVAEYIENMKAMGKEYYELTTTDIDTFVEVAERVWENMSSVYGEDNIEKLRQEIAAVRSE